ncbi:hypothetical protein SBOR_8159 [Sclerotinia borealis F-4128]|uniref:Rhodopsin domain-containing protein n=1 Tax=Sclerotinia borealis (strain F-4128) TaxID=1432307 RepID=W9C6F2_SCLBF|nr:hypothetical protein SBOR_8159 [Sclerotinia borealis F-4128]
MNRTQAIITDTNKTPLVEIFVYIPLAFSFLSVLARLATKLVVLKKLGWHDHLITISLAFAMGQSAAVAIQCANGFGQLTVTTNDGQQQTMLKAEYASNMLFITSLYFANVSVALFLIELTPITVKKRASQFLGIVISLWAISSIVASAFQCHLPNVWDNLNGKCFDRKAFWNSVAIVNIITDAALILIIIVIALHIKASWNRRLTIIAVFGTRIFVIVAVVFQLIYYNKTIVNPVFDLWPAAISTQIAQCLSIVTACFPYLKPFLSSLESGMMRADDLRRRGGTENDDYNGYYVHKSGDSSGLGGKGSKIRKMVSDSLESRKTVETFRLSNLIPGDATTTVGTGEAYEWDGQSHTSQSQIIKETRTWNVDVQSTEHRGASIASE